jgi:hypothetical protein
MQIIRSRTVHDVVIVGSGAGGGMAAKVLTEAGASVLMLEAGVMWDTRKDAKMMAWPYSSPRRGAATPERQFGEFDAGLGGWTLEGEPYTSAPGDRFDWFRTRMLGGRTKAALDREKSLVLRSIKDLEFDHAMRKVSDKDFEDMGARLRVRAARLLRQLDQGTSYRQEIEREIAKRLGTTPAARARACAACGASNDADAKFCKGCGTKLEAA